MAGPIQLNFDPNAFAAGVAGPGGSAGQPNPGVSAAQLIQNAGQQQQQGAQQATQSAVQSIQQGAEAKARGYENIGKGLSRGVDSLVEAIRYNEQREYRDKQLEMQQRGLNLAERETKTNERRIEAEIESRKRNDTLSTWSLIVDTMGRDYGRASQLVGNPYLTQDPITGSVTKLAGPLGTADELAEIGLSVRIGKRTPEEAAAMASALWNQEVKAQNPVVLEALGAMLDEVGASPAIKAKALRGDNLPELTRDAFQFDLEGRLNIVPGPMVMSNQAEATIATVQSLTGAAYKAIYEGFTAETATNVLGQQVKEQAKTTERILKFTESMGTREMVMPGVTNVLSSLMVGVKPNVNSMGDYLKETGPVADAWKSVNSALVDIAGSLSGEIDPQKADILLRSTQGMAVSGAVLKAYLPVFLSELDASYRNIMESRQVKGLKEGEAPMAADETLLAPLRGFVSNMTGKSAQDVSVEDIKGVLGQPEVSKAYYTFRADLTKMMNQLTALDAVHSVGVDAGMVSEYLSEERLQDYLEQARMLAVEGEKPDFINVVALAIADMRNQQVQKDMAMGSDLRNLVIGDVLKGMEKESGTDSSAVQNIKNAMFGGFYLPQVVDMMPFQGENIEGFEPLGDRGRTVNVPGYGAVGLPEEYPSMFGE